MEIVTTTTLSLGSKELSHHGAIVTRLAAIEDLAGMSILCSDKTGTLTLNKMVIQDDCPSYAPCVKNRENLLTFAAMASKWKEPPRDALDTLILGSVNFTTLEGVELLDYMPFDPVSFFFFFKNLIKNFFFIIHTNFFFRLLKELKVLLDQMVKHLKYQKEHHMLFFI